MNQLKRIGNILAPEAKKSDDGRDQWGSRASFVLAAMGGAVGLGNLLRYPGQVFANNGLQWFIPYLIALLFLGIPVLLLEIAIGQASRGGCAIAFDHLNKRTKGVGISLVFNGYVVVVYYVPILAWMMHYFRCSFQSPLPWENRGEEFYYGDVIGNIDPIPGTFTGTGGVASYASYPGTSLVAETVGWLVFVWFVVWLCMFKGMGLTGRVVYFTMGLPFVVSIILIGRGASLENAGAGIKLYMGEWHSEKLAGAQIWQAACGQIFFSIGVGFGYFTSYASYNNKYANAVQDAIIIACSNCLYEVVTAFSVFGVIGHLRLFPDEVGSLGTFTIGFLTYPQALSQMPGAQVWAVLFFFTVMLLGISSSFALLEALTTLVMDTSWGRKTSRTIVSTVIVVISFLLSLMYASEFGFYLLDAVDTWVNGLALFFVVWFEIVCCSSVYRWKDAVSEVGLPAFLVFHIGYFGGTVTGLVVGHTVSPGAGGGVGIGLFFVGLIISLFVAKTPGTLAPSFWSRNIFLSRFWWVAFYSVSVKPKPPPSFNSMMCK